MIKMKLSSLFLLLLIGSSLLAQPRALSADGDADEVGADDVDEDSRANTSDAGRNMLQHQSYK